VAAPHTPSRRRCPAGCRHHDREDALAGRRVVGFGSGGVAVLALLAFAAHTPSFLDAALTLAVLAAVAAAGSGAGPAPSAARGGRSRSRPRGHDASERRAAPSPRTMGSPLAPPRRRASSPPAWPPDRAGPGTRAAAATAAPRRVARAARSRPWGDDLAQEGDHDGREQEGRHAGEDGLGQQCEQHVDGHVPPQDRGEGEIARHGAARAPAGRRRSRLRPRPPAAGGSG
jgi:hypothetical protein